MTSCWIIQKNSFLSSLDDSTTQVRLPLVIIIALGGTSCLGNISTNPRETSQRWSDEAGSADASADNYSARSCGEFDVVSVIFAY